MTWRAAQCLTEFHKQVQRAYPRAAPPATDVFSWGIIGDEDHSNSSDHSPHNFPGWANDVVTAADWPHAPALGLDAGQVAEALRVSRDNRIKYVIYNRRQFSSVAKGAVPAWTWRPYTGSDPHDTHAHLSVVGDGRSDDTRPWQIGAVTSMAFLDDYNAQAMAYRIDAGIRKGSETSEIPGGSQKGESIWLVKHLREMATDQIKLAKAHIELQAELHEIKIALGEIKHLLADAGGSPDTVAILAGVSQLLADQKFITVPDTEG